MPPVRFRDFRRGWWPAGAPEAMPQGTLRRTKGMHSVKAGPIVSRWGATKLFQVGDVIHSLVRFAVARFEGAGSVLYRNGVSIKAGLSADPLSFVKMPSTAGKASSLFVAGGGDLFKVDEAGTVTPWGITAPPDGFTATQLRIEAALQEDQSAGTFVDETADARSVGGADVDPFPATEAAADSFYIGSARPFSGLRIDIATPGVGGVGTWEYWDGAAWQNIETGGFNFIDGTSDLTAAAGDRDITFNAPGDWATKTVDGKGPYYYLRLRVNSVYSTNPVLDQIQLLPLGTLGAGTYKYRVTFRNSATGHRSNPNAAVSIVVDANQRVELGALPVSSDSQVNQREIWRTGANGVLFFLLATVNDNTTTTHTDNTADANLSPTELPLDNAPPDDTFSEAIGPHVSRMWWTRDSVVGRKGRLYYSPIGRAESLLAFIDISDDGDPVQRGVLWNRSLYVFTTSGISRVVGTTEPFSFLRIDGAPGTTLRRTIVPTPLGIVYQAADGIRLFNGVGSILLGSDAVGGLFRGESVDGVAAFEGTVAEFANNELVISDGKTTLALNLADSTWREVGVAVGALHFEEDTSKLTAAFNDRHVILEDEGALTDDGVAVPLEVETWGVLTGASVLGVIRRLFIEADTDGQLLTPRLILDGTEITLPVFSTSKRETVEYAIHRTGRLLGVRLTGSLSKRVEVFGIEADVYIPEDAVVEAKT